MTKTIYTAAGQTIWDIAVQEYGTLEAITQLQADNVAVIPNLNVFLPPGTPLIVQIEDPAGIDITLRQILNDAGVSVNSHEAYSAPVGIGADRIGNYVII